MKKVSVGDLRYRFTTIERLLRQGKEVLITKRRKVIARLVPDHGQSSVAVPDFLERLRSVYGRKMLKMSGAELLEKDRGRY
jgi:antitoxin (DNA-binding transcriptional repressor) of toxin-antitoxin stability system